MSVYNILAHVKKIVVPLKIGIRSYGKKKRKDNMKVTVCGAAGNVGQPLCLMLKQCPYIEELAIYDNVGVSGFGMELSHIDTKCKVCAYSGSDYVKDAFDGSKVVVIVAAAHGTSYASYGSMFEPNANIVHEISQHVAVYSPSAMLVVGTNPVNSMVPLAAQVLKTNGGNNPNAVFGVTAIDVIRANTLVARVQGLQPETVVVPVVGGHTNKTIVPLVSHAKPCADFTIDEIEKITKDVQRAAQRIVKEKTSQCDNLSCSFGIAKFVISLVKGLLGYPNIVECAYVRSDVYSEAKFLATPLLLGPIGITKNYGLPKLSTYEKCLLETAVPLIMQDVKRGEIFAGGSHPPDCDPCKDPCPQDFCTKDEFQ